MKGDAVWMSGAAVAAAVLGAAVFWTFAVVDPERERVDPAGGAAPLETAGAAGPKAVKQFRFAAATTSPDDIAEVRFVTGEGKRMSLAELRGKDVLLNVWATWCGPCREEMPTLDRLQARLGGPDFEVVALSIDRDGVAAVREFYAELGLEALAIYVDPTGMATLQLNVLGIPTTLLLDRDGRELGRYTGPAEWDAEPVVEAIRARLGASPVATPDRSP